MSRAFATSSPPLTSARALLRRAEDIGSALKRGVNVCQRQPVNEVFGPLVTKFVRNFGREGATPIQRGSNASLLGRVQAVRLIRHNALGCARTSQNGHLFETNAEHTTLLTQNNRILFPENFQRACDFPRQPRTSRNGSCST